MNEPISAVNGIPCDADKARAWGEQWRLKHAKRWVNDVGAGLFPVPQSVPAPTIVGRNHSRDVILALERQINGGQQLSATYPSPP